MPQIHRFKNNTAFVNGWDFFVCLGEDWNADFLGLVRIKNDF